MRKHAYQQPEVQLLLTFEMPPVRFERPTCKPYLQVQEPYVDRCESHDFAAETGMFASDDREDEKDELYRSLRESYFRG